MLGYKLSQNITGEIHELRVTLHFQKVVVSSILAEQLLVCSSFYDLALVKANNFIAVLNGGESVCNDDRRAVLSQLLDVVHYIRFCH